MQVKKEFLLALVVANGLIIAAYLCLPSDWRQSFIVPVHNYSADDAQWMMQINNETWKKILLWNSPNRIEAAAFGTGHQAFVNAKCPVSDCYLMANTELIAAQLKQSDYRLLKAFDAVLISVHELWMSTLLPGNYKRPKHQRVVFFTQESPVNSKALDITKLGDVFNWTMTYKMDSDIPLLYGRVYPSKQQPENVITSQRPPPNNKTAKVAWMVSHCSTPSHR